MIIFSNKKTLYKPSRVSNIAKAVKRQISEEILVYSYHDLLRIGVDSYSLSIS